jgi:hypothetical protein
MSEDPWPTPLPAPVPDPGLPQSRRPPWETPMPLPVTTDSSDDHQENDDD